MRLVFEGHTFSMGFKAIYNILAHKAGREEVIYF
jgi:hypothetical protein